MEAFSRDVLLALLEGVSNVSALIFVLITSQKRNGHACEGVTVYNCV